MTVPPVAGPHPGTLAERPARWLGLGRYVVPVVYLVSYALLDWISYIQPFGPFGVTPWNPCTGVSYALILLAGRSYAPLLFIAPPLADFIVPGRSDLLAYHAIDAVIVGGCYTVATYILTSRRVDFDRRLQRLRDLLILLGVAAIAALVVAATYAGVLVASNLITQSDAPSAVLRYWVGDMIGVAVVTTAILLVWSNRHLRRWPALFWIQPLLVAAALCIIFTSSWASRFQLFYLLFLPVFVSSIAFGLEGVSFTLLATQIGLMLALYNFASPDVDVTAYQMVMLVLSVAGLAVGAVVSERWRVEARLRQLQDAQARLDRIASLGVFNASLAHEINQPLSAAATYSRLATEALRQHALSPDLQQALDLADKSAAQVQRAAGVIKRLRDLLQLGRVEIAPVAPATVISDAIALMSAEASRSGAVLDTRLEPQLPAVMADGQQIEQILVNLIRNALEAVPEPDGPPVAAPRRITVSAARIAGGRVLVSVEDNGPGFPRDQLDRSTATFSSTKPKGLGIGLALCDTIVRSHGGEFTLENTPVGARVTFDLRTADVSPDDVA